MNLQTLDEAVQKFLDGLAEGHRQLEASMQAGFAKLRKSQRKNEEENRIGFEELRKSQQKTDEGWEELHKIQRKNEEENRIGFAELRKSQRKTEDDFNSKWSRLVEALVNNQVIPLLAERGILVQRTCLREKGCVDGRNFEFDIIAKNGDTFVVVEVKTTLRPKDVKEFVDELRHFKQWMPRYSDMKIHGAVAFLRYDGEAEVFAAKKGLFTICATGSSATITNPPEFRPKEF